MRRPQDGASSLSITSQRDATVPHDRLLHGRNSMQPRVISVRPQSNSNHRLPTAAPSVSGSITGHLAAARLRIRPFNRERLLLKKPPPLDAGHARLLTYQLMSPDVAIDCIQRSGRMLTSWLRPRNRHGVSLTTAACVRRRGA